MAAFRSWILEVAARSAEENRGQDVVVLDMVSGDTTAKGKAIPKAISIVDNGRGIPVDEHPVDDDLGEDRHDHVGVDAEDLAHRGAAMGFKRQQGIGRGVERGGHAVGVEHLQLGLVDGLLTRMKSEIVDLKRVIATGGLATLFGEDSEHIDEVDSQLTLKGLKIIFDRNRGVRRGKK